MTGNPFAEWRGGDWAWWGKAALLVFPATSRPLTIPLSYGLDVITLCHRFPPIPF